MGILLGMLLLGHLTVVTYGHPILEAPERVTGPWKGDVSIPCTYGPLEGYTQVLVKWLVQRHLDTVTIFLRDSTGDHIQQAKYRGRLHIRHGIPGDVSLQLDTVEMDDRSHYMCEVTWQTPDGNKVVRDKIIELQVQKHSSNLPETKTETSTTTQSSMEATTWEVATEVTPSLDRTTEVNRHFGETVAELGRGLPMFSIILIILLCCMVVFTMAYILLCRKTSQQEHVYEVTRMHPREASDPEETMRVSVYTTGCSSNEPYSQALSNEYSDDPCLGHDCRIIAQINGDYARLLHTVPPDYEVLATQGKNVC
ncbi:V-set and immunoglobulin domain-containing protein 4 isoform X2 [Dipodomys spectabilis]|uniref:V-set and immunoglobulin domain-containing protein 4 isoform X2 n=1 Tax=Dipodomys spectabilis TaxID=105255 RepID=UPI001C5424FC|nr:V-set and immunoglobulin domain-containing protein 4 isoform X2 [Dipodomys spectabilis]